MKEKSVKMSFKEYWIDVYKDSTIVQFPDFNYLKSLMALIKL